MSKRYDFSRWARPVAILVLVILTAQAIVACDGTPTPNPAGGAQCLAALDFNVPVSDSITLDGRSCTTGGTSDQAPFASAGCGGGPNDWPFSIEHVDTDFNAYLTQRTRITHYRITPPVPPTESDLYLVFEAEGVADIDDITMVSFALNEGANPNDNFGFMIKPTTSPTPLTGSGTNQTPDSITVYTGSTWTEDPTLAGAVDAEFAYDAAAGYWGVEVVVRLPDLGVTGDSFYMTTHWRTTAPGLPAASDDWTPWSAAPPAAAANVNMPNPDPMEWTWYSFGTSCAPDVYINSEWNTCTDIYINAQDANARVIGVNNVNEFHAIVHGDIHLDPGLGGRTADDVLVYMDISHLGIGGSPWAMNYDHTDANINWEGAGNTLQTTTPVPPAPFSVAPQATNDDVRVSWKPADEDNNPFADGQHVCVNAYVYYKDDPNFDNNFGQCNMQFVDTVPGRAQFFSLLIGPGFRRIGGLVPNELILVPTVVNSPIPLTEANEWQVELTGEWIEQVGALEYRLRLPEPDYVPKGELSFVVPERKRSDAPERRADGFVSRSDLVTRKYYGNRPLLIVQSFVPIPYTPEKGTPVTLLRPGSYAGFAINVRQ